MDDVSRIAFAAAYGLVFFLAMHGNCFVIRSASKRLTNRSHFNLLIINMAVCDILYALAVVSWNIKMQVVGVLWFTGHFATFLCKFQPFAINVAVTSSVLSLTVMAVDRFMAIVPEKKRPLTRKAVLIIILIVWSISCLIASPQLYAMNVGFRNYNGKTIPICSPVWSGDRQTDIAIRRAEVNILFLTNFALPVIVMAVLYSIIVRFLWLRKIPGASNKRNERTLMRQRRKAVLMLLTMVAVFAAAWLPIYVIVYLISYAPSTYKLIPPSLSQLLFWLAHANCAINPFLYPIFHKEYREEFCLILRRMFSCCCCPAPISDYFFRTTSVFRRWSYSVHSSSGRTMSEGTRHHGSRAFSVWDSVTSSVGAELVSRRKTTEQNMSDIISDKAQ